MSIRMQARRLSPSLSLSPSLWEGLAKRGEGEVEGVNAQVSSPSPAFGRPSRREGDLFRFYKVLIVVLTVVNLAYLRQLNAQSSTSKIDFIDLQSTIDTLLPKIRPAVVCIECGGGSGSGVIVTADGLILTASHVIDKSQELTIVYPDGRRFKGKSLGTYGPADAGMAQILEGAPHPFVNVATGKDLQINDTVIALGHPGGFDQQRGTPLRIGHILNIGENFIGTDTALIGGDSGGPSFDLKGNVIGIHSHISDQLYVNSDGHIASFHLAWDFMRNGKHDKVHYSKSIGDKEKKESQDKDDHTRGDANQVPDPQRQPKEIPDKTGASKLRSLAEQSKVNGGSLKLSRDELLKLRQNLASRTESLAPPNGMRLIDGWGRQWLSQFQPKAEPLRRGVYKLVAGGRTVALGTSVRSDGLLVTKASEVKGKSVSVELAPLDLRPAELVAVDESLDLAILRVQDATFEVPDWRHASLRLNAPIEMGTLCAAVGTADQPVGFGVISVAQRPLDGKSGAYLGVTVAADSDGVRIVDIKPNSPAIRAGLKGSDRITAVEGHALMNNDQLTAQVALKVPGDLFRIDIARGDTQLTLLVKLGDGANLAPMPGAREQAIDSESTLMNKRRWFFAKGMQHDCAISARDCGGPLIDLEGRILGINIARAGRTHSYAIPTSDVIQFLRSNEIEVLKENDR